MANSVKAEADKLGINVKIVDAQNDSAKQANDVADLIQSKVDVLIVNPVDSAAISNSVIAANQAKIPVITIDRSSDKGDVAVHIASNNVKGGEMAAQYIIDKLGNKHRLQNWKVFRAHLLHVNVDKASIIWQIPNLKF